MNIIGNNKGLSLFITLAFLALFSVIVVGYIATTAFDSKAIKRSTYSNRAFFLAEAGIHRATYELRHSDAYTGSAKTPINLPDGSGSMNGSYSVTVAAALDEDGNETTDKVLTSTGYFTDPTSGEEVMKVIEVTMADFFGNAIWGDTINADHLDLNDITGSTKSGHFPEFDNDIFIALRDMATSQIKPNGENNLYPAGSDKDYPATFWYNTPPAPNSADDTPGVEYNGVMYNTIPNVAYLEGDLEIHGNNTIYGFFVVAGNVINDPDAEAEGEVSGNSGIVGCIYTQGDFEINGGGNAVNVDGGVWCKAEFDQGGSGELSYNATYMDAIDNLNILPKFIIINWNEKYS